MNIVNQMREKAREMLEGGEVKTVLAWREGTLPFEAEPTFLNSHEELVYNGFCGANLCKYLMRRPLEDGKVLVFLKPCDAKGLDVLLSMHQAGREGFYAVGIGCAGMLDAAKIGAKGIIGILEIEEDSEELHIRTVYGDEKCLKADVLLEKCLACTDKEHCIYDELLGAELSRETAVPDKYASVAALEEKSAEERFAFWRGELSRCIRCNACRNACPACNCVKCIFDNPKSGVDSKTNINEFEENLFHVIRAYHAAGKCMDCGECGRVCPQKIPLHLLNRKFIREIEEYEKGEGENAVASRF